MRSVVCCYEDSRGGPNFGPHALLLACCVDQGVGDDRWRLQQSVRSLPLNGVGKLLSVLARPPDQIAPRGEAVVVIADADRVHEHLGVATTASISVVIAAMRTRRSQPQVCCELLDRNVETLVHVAAGRLGQTSVAKDRLERDRVLNAAAAANRDVRDSIRAAVPTFDRLVRLVCQLTTLPLGSPCPD